MLNNFGTSYIERIVKKVFSVMSSVTKHKLSPMQWKKHRQALSYCWQIAKADHSWGKLNKVSL